MEWYLGIIFPPNRYIQELKVTQKQNMFRLVPYSHLFLFNQEDTHLHIIQIQGDQ